MYTKENGEYKGEWTSGGLQEIVPWDVREDHTVEGQYGGKACHSEENLVGKADLFHLRPQPGHFAGQISAGVDIQ